MLTTTLTERRKFVALVTVGFIIAFGLIPLGHDLACVSSQQNTSTTKNSAAAQQNKDQSNKSIETKNPNTNSQGGEPDQVQKIHWPVSLLCGDLKLTDLALAVLTYTLAVIAWFSLRSTEQIAESVERAYIFHGYSPFKFRNDQATFTLNMINTGRMPGGIKRVGYKFLARSNLPQTRKQIDWEWEIIPYDYIVRPNMKADIGQFLSLSGNHILVSFIEYQDLFTKRTHTSWMGMHIAPSSEQTMRAGGDAWNDWD